MDITVIKLREGMGETFVNYFKNLDFSHETHWSSCFCRFYHTDCDIQDWMKRSGDDNIREAVEEIDKENMSGFLAYEKDKCIGWLSANNWKSYKRLHEWVEPVAGDKKVGVVICYVIHHAYRHRGVATALLNAAIDDFKKEEYDFVLSMPVYAEKFSPKMYRGTVSMYEKAGFKKINQYDDVYVYRLDL